MFGKYLLVALIFVSVAQVFGDELKIAINKALRKLNVMDEKLKNTLYASGLESNDKLWLIEINSQTYVQKAREAEANSRRALRKVAAATEEKSRQDDRPESVFECIKGNEENASIEIEALTNKSQSDVEGLYATKRENMTNAYKPFNNYETLINDVYYKTVEDIKKCENPKCLTTPLKNYTTFVNSMSSDIRNVQKQIAIISTNFRRDANKYYANSYRQINRIKSIAIRNIKICYLDGLKY